MQIDAPSPQRQTALAGLLTLSASSLIFRIRQPRRPSESFDTLIFVDRQGTVRDYYQEVSYARSIW